MAWTHKNKIGIRGKLKRSLGEAIEGGIVEGLIGLIEIVSHTEPRPSSSEKNRC